MIVQMIRGKIIRTVLCCIVYDSVVHNDTQTYEQFLKFTVGLHLGSLGLCLLFAFFAIMFLSCLLLLC